MYMEWAIVSIKVAPIKCVLELQAKNLVNDFPNISVVS